MDRLNFQLPGKHEDLPEKYPVNELDREIAVDRLNDVIDNLCEHAVNITEPDIFDPLYSIVSHFAEIDVGTKIRISDVLCTGISCLSANIDLLFSSANSSCDDDFFADTVQRTRTSLKMHVFLISWIVKLGEKEAEQDPSKIIAATAAKKTAAAAAAKGTKKTTTTNSSSSDLWNWETQREKMVRVLSQVLELNLPKLWSLPTPEAPFLALFTSLCSVILESPYAMKCPKTKTWLSKILALSCSRYGQRLGCTMVAVHALMRQEHVALSLPEVCIALQGFHEHQLISDILLEVGRTDMRELARDANISKNVGNFIMEISEKLSNAALGSMSVLLPHLDGDSYVIRNAVVHMLSRVLVNAVGKDPSETAARTRDSLLDVLVSRCHDVNAFSRSKLLQVWTYLAENKMVPVKRLPEVASMALERLEDKSSHVRKAGIILMGTLLQYNPYAQSLPLSIFQKKLADSNAELTAVTAKLDKQMVNRASSSSSPNKQGEDEEVSNDQLPSEDQIQVLMSRVNFYEAAVKFISQFHSAIARLLDLLNSKINTDVVESIELLCGAAAFGIESARAGVRQMLLLVWSREQSVKDAVLDAYRRLFFPAQAMETRVQLHAVSMKLIQLVKDANVGEVTSLEVLLLELTAKKVINTALFAALLDIALGKVPNVTSEDSENAVLLISLIGGASSEMLQPHLPGLTEQAFGAKGEQNPLMARHCCSLLLKIHRSHALPRAFVDAVAPKMIEFLFNKKIPNGLWFTVAEQTLNAIYETHPYPHIPATALLRRLTRSALNKLGNSNNAAEEQDGEVEGDDNSSIHTTNNTNLSARDLSRALFVAGHVGIKQLVMIEKTQRAKQQQQAAAAEAKQQPAKTKSSKSSKSSKASKSKPKKKTKSKAIDDDSDEDDVEEEEEEEEEQAEEDLGAQLGVNSQALAPEEAEEIMKIAETDIVSPQSLVGVFGPIAASIVAKKDENPELRTCAVLTLSRLMCISQSLCEQNLQLLFSVLSAAEEPSVRANIVVAVGDLTFRFPLIVEPWIPFLYSRLRDSETRVRKNAMLVLTHLILNDMIKIKGQISEMAMCLEDKEDCISNLARVFFHEFSQKGNGQVLYNVLPDIISRLSSDGMLEPCFRKIMSYLFGYVTKEKQAESLVDRLCARMKDAGTERQARDVAFCMSLLNGSDRSIKKMLENFKCFASWLTDEDVTSSVLTVISKAKKAGKPEGKNSIEELENKINEVKGCVLKNEEINVDDDGNVVVVASNKQALQTSVDNIANTTAVKKTTSAAAAAARKTTTAAAAAAAKTTKTTKTTTTATKRAPTRTTKKKIVESESEDDPISDDDDDGDFSEEENVKVAPKPKATTSRTRAR